jgi:hypothetical protein
VNAITINDPRKEHAMTTKLTTTQHAILNYAIENTGGCVEWFPDNINGGARTKVLEAMANKALITRDSAGWFVTAEGYYALGAARSKPATIQSDPEIEAAVSAAEASWARVKQDADEAMSDPELDAYDRAVACAKAGAVLRKEREAAMAKVRKDSKLARIIEMLRSPYGAKIREICEATGWQAHTVRATLCALKKKGVKITTERPGKRCIYKIDVN